MRTISLSSPSKSLFPPLPVGDRIHTVAHPQCRPNLDREFFSLLNSDLNIFLRAFSGYFRKFRRGFRTLQGPADSMGGTFFKLTREPRHEPVQAQPRQPGRDRGG